MATSGKSTRAALAALLAALVTVSLLAGTCTGDIIGTPISIQAPIISLVNLNFTNHLTKTINVTLSTDIEGVKFTTSAVIEPGASKEIPVNIAGVTGVGASGTITVDEKDVYGIPISVIERIIGQTGTVKIKVSCPCLNDEPGILLTSTSPLPGGTEENCTGPPMTSS